MSPKPFVFIAGAGPVGLAAAVELTRRGFPVRVVDPDPAPSPESRALLVNHRTLDLLQASGVADDLLTRGHRMHALVVRYEERVIARMDLANMPHRHKFGLILPQSDTEAVLADALESLGGRLERSCSLVSFAQDELGVNVALSSGETARAEYLLGADGARSTVRKALGLGFPGESEPQTFGLADVELADWPFAWDEIVLTQRKDHVIGCIPMRPGLARFVSSRPDTLAILPREAKVKRVIWQSEFRINYRQVERYQVGRVLLAGDAAHIHSPVGGRGMNLGIEDACWLAWLLEENRLAEYSELRHAAGAKVLKFSEAPTSFIASSSFFALLVRRWIAPALMNRRFVQRRILPRLGGLDTLPPPWV